MEGARVVVCEYCGGDGWFADDRPIPTLDGPHYGPDVRCAACNGDGEYEIEAELITEQDVWEL